MRLGVLLLCMSVPGAFRRQKRTLDPLRPELQMVVSPVGSWDPICVRSLGIGVKDGCEPPCRNGIQVLCKNSQCS